MVRRGRRDGTDPRRLVAPALVGAVAVAPLLGLLYGRAFGLGVLVVALSATIAVAVRNAPAVPPEARGRLRALIAVNLAILAAAVLLIVLGLG